MSIRIVKFENLPDGSRTPLGIWEFDSIYTPKGNLTAYFKHAIDFAIAETIPGDIVITVNPANPKEYDGTRR